MKAALRNTTPDDLPFVKQAESAPENRKFVGQWEMPQHRESPADPDIRHMIIEDALTHKAVGYAILAGLTDANRSIELRRLVVTEKKRGYGGSALRWIKKFAFGELGFDRLWLDTKACNEKAIKLYESCGLRKREGSASASLWTGAAIRCRCSPC